MIKDTSKEGLIKTFFSYSIPCIIAMVLTSCITIIDGIFIGNKLGEKGLAAVNLTLPVLYLFLGITIMIGVGGVTIATHSLGGKDYELARKRFSFTLTINLVITVIVILILTVFLDNVVLMLNGRGEIGQYVRDYLGIILCFYVFMMTNIVYSMFIRSEGKPGLSLFFGLAGNIINIFLDYIFIFKYNLGMKGAALATGISVVIPFVLGSIYFLSGKSTYRLSKFKFDILDFKSIIFNGTSEFIGQISFCITTYLFNYVIISRIGVEGVAAFTIIGYISFIEYMVITGIAQGVNMLASYSYGAKDKDSIMYLLSIGLRAVVFVGIATFGISMVASEEIVKLFIKNDSEIIKIASVGMKIFAFSFLINGYNFIASAYFTSLGDAKKSATISVLRSLLLISLFVIVLPIIFGDTGIWLSVPVTEIVTFIFSYLFIKKSKLTLNFD